MNMGQALFLSPFSDKVHGSDRVHAAEWQAPLRWQGGRRCRLTQHRAAYREIERERERVCVPVYIYTDIDVYLHMHICKHIYTCIYTCTHICIYIYICTQYKFHVQCVWGNVCVHIDTFTDMYRFRSLASKCEATYSSWRHSSRRRGDRSSAF